VSPDEDATVLIPRITRRERRIAARHRPRASAGWVLYSIAVLGLIAGSVWWAVQSTP
jgi:hypothetical protein